MRAQITVGFIVVLVAAAAFAAGAAARQPPVAPIVTVVRHGGLCMVGAECRSVAQIGHTISATGYVPRRLEPRERAALLGAIGKLDVRYFKTHPFTGTCPIAYDGQESIYRFRGFPLRLASCKFDLAGVEAVRIVDRLLRSLKPARR